jgi:hypothetical protein
MVFSKRERALKALELDGYKILKVKGLFSGEVPYVIHIAGYGSTCDIGFQFLKATLIRTSFFVEMNEYLTCQK